MDLLDFYRGRLSLRRVGVLVGQLPEDAALYRTGAPADRWRRDEVLLLAVERRLTGLWRDVMTTLGATITEDQMAAPVPVPALEQQRAVPDAESPSSLRDIARWMRS